MNQLYHVMRKASYRIRFELGLEYLKEHEYMKEVLHRVNSINDLLFDEGDIVSLIVKTNNYRRQHFLNLKRFLKDDKLLYRLRQNVDYISMEGNNSGEVVYELKVRSCDLNIQRLFQAIANADFAVKPRINGDVYLFNETKQSVLHMYDDRGCDVIGLNRENMLPFYQTFRSWILDYDRYQIDQLFKDGLHEQSETCEELENRLRFDEQKVKEMGINLYHTNTCEITHLIEVPLEEAEACNSEIHQTGFQINSTLNDQKAIFYAKKTEALALIDYQTHLISLYAKKFNGKYCGWTASPRF